MFFFISGSVVKSMLLQTFGNLKNKVLFLFCKNRNHPLLPQLPKHKDKKKWQKVLQKTKLFVQSLFRSVYRRLRINVQRLSFLPDTEDFNNAYSWHWHYGYICNRKC